MLKTKNATATMSEPTVRVLCHSEMDFCCIHTDLGTLAERLERCTDSKRAPVAARRLRALQGSLAAVLGYLDVEVSAAALAAETLGSPPF